LREGNITVHMTALPGTSLQESVRLGNRITEGLLKVPSVQSVAQRAGRAELGTDTMGTHESEIDVNMKATNGKQVNSAQAGVREVLSQIPGPLLTLCYRNRSCAPPPGSGISGDTAHAIFFPRCNSFPANLSQLTLYANSVYLEIYASGVPGTGWNSSKPRPSLATSPVI
jgi:Cu/Ag efflux pump CusA